ncbi:MAG: DUF2892 domain-containing protein [Candidatus Aminicenantes bacterium]|nr:DUF2892 domain-containing protein [Candidatus Aminicenantes bacterium]
MKKNMGVVDRTIRTIVALVVVALLVTKTLTGTLAIVLGVVAVVFLLTSLVSFCPLYTFLGIRTNKK